MSVYCKDCKHHRDDGLEDTCVVKNVIAEDPVKGPFYVTYNCKLKNHNCRCEDFVPSLTYLLKDIVKCLLGLRKRS
jgi:hypothetical protein